MKDNIDKHKQVLAFNDIVCNRMTDEEAYEIECHAIPEAIKHFIMVFGQGRWDEISGGNDEWF